MTAITRRSLRAGVALLAASPARPAFFDGQTIFAGERDLVLTDILAPSPAALGGGAEPGAEHAIAVLSGLLASASVVSTPATAPDRWGRASGPARLRLPDGAETTVQEELLRAGAARVHPQSADGALLDRYFNAEDEARSARRWLWLLAR